MPIASSDEAGTPGEPRELFAQISGTGRMTLYPQPDGWTKTSITGFELAALRGVAARQGVTLTRGIFDGNIDTRFRGDGTGKVPDHQAGF